MKIRFLFFSLLATGFVSCSSDDGSPTSQSGDYSNGVLVSNEGNATSGSVSFIGSDNAVSQDIFTAVNGSAQSIGGYVQSVFFDGDKAYIISNGSNKITVVNRYTFAYEATISDGLSVPRYGLVYNGKAYVTNLAGFDTNADDYVAVIDLATNTVEAPIAVNDYADHIVQAGGKLYVANGSFGMGTKVTIIDPDTASIQTTIDFGQSPNSLDVYNNVVFVGCGSYVGDSKIGRIYSADGDVHDEVTLASTIANAQNLDIDGNRVYFTSGTKIYSVALNSVAVTDTPIIEVDSENSYFGYGFAVHGTLIYIAEPADDFASDGKAYIYTKSGELVTTVTTGLGPNGFYFND